MLYASRDFKTSLRNSTLHTANIIYRTVAFNHFVSLRPEGLDCAGHTSLPNVVKNL